MNLPPQVPNHHDSRPNVEDCCPVGRFVGSHLYTDKQTENKGDGYCV